MATAEVTVKIKLDFVHLEKLVEEYLSTLPSNDGCEIYDSYRGHAEAQVYGFMAWLKERNG